MATLSIELDGVDQAIQLKEMAEHFLQDIDSMIFVADGKTTVYLESLRTMWAQIEHQANQAQEQLTSKLQ